MVEVPDKAIYRCPEHGLFVVATDGIVWRKRSCTKMLRSMTGMEFPCGTLSPLAGVDDPDLTDKDKHISTLTPDQMAELRQSIEATRAQRAQQKALDDDKQNYIFGGSENRRNGKQMALPAAPAEDVEQKLFEAAERERMRAAMNEDWDAQ